MHEKNTKIAFLGAFAPTLHMDACFTVGSWKRILAFPFAFVLYEQCIKRL